LRSRCFNHLSQDRSTPMTEQAISPSVTTQVISQLRQRMIEDMSIRKFTAKLNMTMCRGGQGLRNIPRPLSRHRERGGGAALSAASGIERRRYANDQRHLRGAALLLQGDARSRGLGPAFDDTHVSFTCIAEYASDSRPGAPSSLLLNATRRRSVHAYGYE
jgi:hypothetical protein